MAINATANAGGKSASRPMSSEERKVIFASSLGTVFEWYDFYLYGSLAAIIAKQFFSGLDAGSAFIFALLAFAAGFIVRPFGALVCPPSSWASCQPMQALAWQPPSS